MSKESYYLAKSLYEDWSPYCESFLQFSVDTPFLLMRSDLQIKIFRQFAEHMLCNKVFYAVKSNPDRTTLECYKKLGSFFDVASIYELNRLLQINVSVDKISFGQTIKKSSDIRIAYEKGVRWFTSDSQEDIFNLSQNAPGSFVMLRLSTSGEDSDWPLSKKFGENEIILFELGKYAKSLGLQVRGLSFHVGSQQKNIKSWRAPIVTCAALCKQFALVGIDIRVINLGGGFPATYLSKTPDRKKYLDQIYEYRKELFPQNMEIWVEPGRGLVGDCGVVVSQVIRKSVKSAQQNWLYLDVGVFSGLIETLGESIKYPIYVVQDPSCELFQSYVLSGPTCDSMDILYENFLYSLPKKISEKSLVYIFSCGAYTSSYSSVGFNGFPPLPTYVI